MYLELDSLAKKNFRQSVGGITRLFLPAYNKM